MELKDISNEVKYIGFLFENLESVDVPISKFREITIGKVKEFTTYGGTYFMTSYLSAEINYNDFSELSYNESEEEYPLGMFTRNPVSNSVDDRPHILGALIKRNDFAAIELLDKNREPIKTIYLPDGESETFKNASVRTVVDEGFIKVTVSGEFVE